MFEDVIEGPVLAGSVLQINAGEGACSGFCQFLICSDLGPHLPLLLSPRRLQWSCSDLLHRCLPTSLLSAEPQAPQKEAFPLCFFMEYLSLCFLQPLTVA